VSLGVSLMCRSAGGCKECSIISGAGRRGIFAPGAVEGGFGGFGLSLRSRWSISVAPARGVVRVNPYSLEPLLEKDSTFSCLHHPLKQVPWEPVRNSRQLCGSPRVTCVPSGGQERAQSAPGCAGSRTSHRTDLLEQNGR
jgi:hypothetical protein